MSGEIAGSAVAGKYDWHVERSDAAWMKNRSNSVYFFINKGKNRMWGKIK